MKNMKKIIFSLMLTLTCSMFFVCNVKAVGEDEPLQAKVPNIMPSDNDSVYALFDNNYYFNRINFKLADGTINGLYMRSRIIIY